MLAFNPFIDLINMLSDTPNISRTCVCADDIGSALRSLDDLRVLHSIFRLAGKTSNMHLKPSKCFLVITVADVTPELSQRIKQWLLTNLPDWAEFRIVSKGKYLGVYLGRDAGKETYALPCSKYLERVDEIASGSAPSLVSVLRYNERAATVFSFVSQVIPMHDPQSFAALEQRGVHRMLKLPPNCMSRKLMHSLEPFHCKSPTAILAMCRASMYRLARTELVFFQGLHKEVIGFLGDSLSLRGLCLGAVPCAGIQDPPLIEAILDAVYLRGEFARYSSLVGSTPDLAWMSPPLPPPPPSPSPSVGGRRGLSTKNQVPGQSFLHFGRKALGGKPQNKAAPVSLSSDALFPSPLPPSLAGKIQSGAYSAFRRLEVCSDFPLEMSQKLVVTLGHELSCTVHAPFDWVLSLTRALVHSKQHVAFCVFKTLIGGWTTSFRMHEHDKLPCIFGCHGEKDLLTHYLLCFPLWHICSSVLGIQAPWSLEERIGIMSPSPEKAQLLALTFMVYHNSKSRLKELGGLSTIGHNHVQTIAADSSRTFACHVT